MDLPPQCAFLPLLLPHMYTIANINNLACHRLAPNDLLRHQHPGRRTQTGAWVRSIRTTPSTDSHSRHLRLSSVHDLRSRLGNTPFGGLLPNARLDARSDERTGDQDEVSSTVGLHPHHLTRACTLTRCYRCPTEQHYIIPINNPPLKPALCQKRITSN